MVEISVQILATSISVQKDDLRYKVKTWWCHVDVEDSSNVIKLPNLEMIEPYYYINGKETTIFVEMWYQNVELFPPGTMRFLGMAKCKVDDLLKNPNSNPTVEWLEIYDPIEDIIRGRLLLKIDAKFIAGSNATPNMTSTEKDSKRKMSSYFIDQPYSSKNNSPSPSSTSSTSSLKFRNVPVQTEALSAIGCPTGLPFNSEEDQSKTSTANSKCRRFSTGTSAGIQKVTKEKVNQNKKLGEKCEKGSPFNVKIAGKSHTIQVTNSESKGALSSTKPRISKKSSPADSRISNESSENTTPGRLSSNKSTPQRNVNPVVREEDDDSVEDVIHLLNDNFNSVPRSTFSTNGKKPTIYEAKEETLIKNTSKSTVGNPDILKLRRLHFDKTIRTVQEDTVLRAYRKLAPEESENDTDYFSPCGLHIGTADSGDLTILGLNVGIIPKSNCPTSSCSDSQQCSSFSKSANEQSKRSEQSLNSSGRPPRSQRIAAAIYNDTE